MIKLTDLVKGHGKFEQGVVYSNPYHTAFTPQVKEEVIEEATTKLDFAPVNDVEFYVSSPKNNIVLLPKSMKDRDKIDTMVAKMGSDGKLDFIGLLKTHLEKKLGLKVIEDKRYSGAGYAFEIDMDTLLKKL
jgi:hypothetical protein